MDENNPFDARKELMCEDRAGPRQDWKLSSLLVELKDVLKGRFEEAGESREALGRFRAAADELYRRGLDADSIIRYGMVNEILGPMLVALLIGHLIPGESNESGHHAAELDLDGWRELLRVPGHEFASRSELMRALDQATATVFAPMLNWVGTVGLEELVSLSLPDSAAFWQSPPAPKEFRTLAHQYRWLVDRVTETYLKSWSTASLMLEYRYRRNIEPMGFPSFVLETRELDLDDVAREIALRAALEWNPSSNDPPSSEFLLNQMTTHARSLLTTGRCSAAAALFEFAVEQWPDDASAHNNLGFCLIPDQPERAIVHLGTAARLDYQPAIINTYNRMCCHIVLKEERHALDAAEEYWQARASGEPDHATFWMLDENGGWNLDVKAEPCSSMLRLAIAVARRQGWKDEEERWQKRLAE